jgi:hypothetical protein
LGSKTLKTPETFNSEAKICEKAATSVSFGFINTQRKKQNTKSKEKRASKKPKENKNFEVWSLNLNNPL